MQGRWALFFGNIGLAGGWATLFTMALWLLLLMTQPSGIWLQSRDGLSWHKNRSATASEILQWRWGRHSLWRGRKKVRVFLGVFFGVALTSHIILAQFATFQFSTWYVDFWNTWHACLTEGS